MRRLTVFFSAFLALACMFAARTAHASFAVPEPTLQVSWPTGGGVAAYSWKATAAAACADAVGKPHYGQTVAVSAAYPNEPWRCSVDYASGGAAIVYLATNTLPGVCPANSTESSGQCTCSAGYDQSGSMCVAHVGEAMTPDDVLAFWTMTLSLGAVLSFALGYIGGYLS